MQATAKTGANIRILRLDVSMQAGSILDRSDKDSTAKAVGPYPAARISPVSEPREDRDSNSAEHGAQSPAEAFDDLVSRPRLHRDPGHRGHCRGLLGGGDVHQARAALEAGDVHRRAGRRL